MASIRANLWGCTRITFVFRLTRVRMIRKSLQVRMKHRLKISNFEGVKSVFSFIFSDILFKPCIVLLCGSRLFFGNFSTIVLRIILEFRIVFCPIFLTELLIFELLIFKLLNLELLNLEPLNPESERNLE